MKTFTDAEIAALPLLVDVGDSFGMCLAAGNRVAQQSGRAVAVAYKGCYVEIPAGGVGDGAWYAFLHAKWDEYCVASGTTVKSASNNHFANNQPNG